MSSISSSDRDAAKHRRLLNAAVKDSMRELRSQLAALNHQVGDNLKLKDVDLDCLDLIARHGPLSPTALARLSGLHPATTTGILDRLERGGWVARDRDPADRRGVVIRVLRDRAAEIFRQYAGMNESLDQICAGYRDEELELLADFLRRAADAGRAAADELA